VRGQGFAQRYEAFKFFMLLAVWALVLCVLPSAAQARIIIVPGFDRLIKRAQLVFFGQVKSVKPSGQHVALSYPTYDGNDFEWLNVEVEVIEPIKGAKKGQTVKTMMLTLHLKGGIFDGPGTVNPQLGQYFLLCLLPTDAGDSFAAVTAPRDDNLAIFPLDRKLWAADEKGMGFFEDRKRIIRSLVDDGGKISASGVEELRKTFKNEIAIAPAKDVVVHLQWKKETTQGGWQTNVPDTGGNAAKPKPESEPTTPKP
jgi:hypothetical protein